MTDPNLDMLDIEDEGAEVSTPSEIYNELLACGELILTIPAEEEERLRKGLASTKAKQNAKLKEAGLATDNTVLSFTSAPSKEHDGAVQIRITLAARNGIKILQKQYPDGQF